MSELLPEPVGHSFGGRAFDRYITDFETDPGAGGGDAAVGDSADPALEPAAAPWSPSQEDWEQIRSAVGYLADLEQRRASAYQAPDEEQPVELDPFSESFADSLRRVIREETAPLASRFQDLNRQEGEARARDILADDASRNGEFDIDMARMRANQLLPQFQGRLGIGPKAAEAALEQAAKDQRDWESKYAETAVSRHTNRLTTLAGAPGEPGSSYSVGAQQRTMPDYRQGGSVTAQFFPKENAQQ